MEAFVNTSQSIKVNGAVSASGGSGTIYTAPANGYAILMAARTVGNVGAQIGGQQVLKNHAGSSEVPILLYVGAGQSVVVTTDSAGTLVISGVEFLNS